MWTLWLGRLLACADPAVADTMERVDLPDPPPAPAPAATLVAAFPPPWGATRVDADAFGDWLRDLPLKPPGSPVLSYTGERMAMPAARVIDLPVAGVATLQCADSAIRLRATWMRATGLSPVFHYTSGDPSRWADWARGMRPRVSGSEVHWTLVRAPDASDAAFEAWLRDLYTYAGSISLLRDTEPASEPAPGELLVTPGSPGHVVVLLDVARAGGRTWVLAGQGYMPAMDFHVVDGPDGGWFEVDGATLETRPIAMPWSTLRRWR